MGGRAARGTVRDGGGGGGEVGVCVDGGFGFGFGFGVAGVKRFWCLPLCNGFELDSVHGEDLN